MNFELEKILAKVSGENAENFAKRVISDSDKAQINFAFNQMFSGLSLLEWMQNVPLADAWKKTLDKMRDFIFSIDEKNYIIDYLRVAIFDFKKQIMKMLTASVHAGEFMQYDSGQRPELEKTANERIQNGIDIIKNILSNPHDAKNENHKSNQNTQILEKLYNRDREHEIGERERIKK